MDTRHQGLANTTDRLHRIAADDGQQIFTETQCPSELVSSQGVAKRGKKSAKRISSLGCLRLATQSSTPSESCCPDTLRPADFNTMVRNAVRSDGTMP